MRVQLALCLKTNIETNLLQGNRKIGNKWREARRDKKLHKQKNATIFTRKRLENSLLDQTTLPQVPLLREAQ